MQSIKDQIIQDIAAGGVLIYSKSYCPYCVEAKQILTAGNVQFKSYELDQIPNGQEIQNNAAQLNGQRTVPMIYIGKQFIGGCSDLKSLKSSGKLGTALSAAGIAHSF